MKNRPMAMALGSVFFSVMGGIGIGLLMGWVVWPIDQGNATFADLANKYKEDYIVLVSAAYAQDGSLDKARVLLDQLESPNPAQWVTELASTYIREGRDPAELQHLVKLAHGLGMADENMIAYLPTDTPMPSATPSPTPAPTNTVPPTMTFTPTPSPTDVPPTDTAVPPTDTPVPPTDTPPPTNTPVPATKPPKPTATKAPPTATPKPQAAWSWAARLVGPGEDAQTCTSGLLQIRVTVVNAAGAQIPGVWVYDKYSGFYNLTGNVDSPDWGPGETKFEYGYNGGGSLCIASSQGGPCVSEFTRDMPCDFNPPFEDKWAAGYCQCCSPEAAANKELCRQLYEAGDTCIAWPRGHYAWRVVFRRSY
jgi:hypothetical protein